MMLQIGQLWALGFFGFLLFLFLGGRGSFLPAAKGTLEADPTPVRGLELGSPGDGLSDKQPES